MNETVRVETKTIWKSKKFWFNALTVVTVLATLFGYTPNQELSDQVTGVLVTFAPVVNLLLTMFATKKPITLK